VLFLDELPEFSRHTLENLREPLETGIVTIARARQTLRFPARFQLIAAMNPCPCGYAGDTQRECRCSPDQVRRYRERISGPFLDRIDICLRLNREQLVLNRTTAHNESSAAVSKRVADATRWRNERNGLPNAQLDTAALQRWCWPEKAGLRLLETAADRFGLSRRACDRVLRVSRSIADIAGLEKIGRDQVAEALGYRI
jgi:magnesium chelatase family protein